MADARDLLHWWAHFQTQRRESVIRTAPDGTVQLMPLGGWPSEQTRSCARPEDNVYDWKVDGL